MSRFVNFDSRAGEKLAVNPEFVECIIEYGNSSAVVF